MNKILISLKEDIENGLTLMEIKAAMMHIMADSGYNEPGTQARINKFVTRKRKEITSMKKKIINSTSTTTVSTTIAPGATAPPVVATSTSLSTSVGSLTEATPSTSVVTQTIFDEIQQDTLNLDDHEEVRIHYY